MKSCSYSTGVFTDEDIIYFGGQIVGIEKLPTPYTADKDYFLQVGPDFFLGPSGKLDDYVNHSCDPNTGIFFNSGRVRLSSIKYILAGSQITFDYSTTMKNFNWQMSCDCGSADCRHQIKNFDELPDTIKTKYIELGIVPKYLSKKNNQFPAQRSRSKPDNELMTLIERYSKWINSFRNACFSPRG
jgi:hypothetical protein